jgi:hypothetical protein
MATVLEQVVAQSIAGNHRDLTSMSTERLGGPDDLDRGAMHKRIKVFTCNDSDVHALRSITAECGYVDCPPQRPETD